MDKTNTSISAHLEGFLQSARNLETALAEEKKKTQKIAQEYIATRTTLENGVRELKTRLYARENTIRTLTEKLKALENSEAILRKDHGETLAREKKAAEELEQYKLAWNEVLARENHARSMLAEFEKTKNIANDRENRLLQMEMLLKEAKEQTAAKTLALNAKERELQTARNRIQVAEAKHQQIQKEMTALNASKKSAEEAMRTMEAALRKDLEWQLTSEKARLRNEVEREIAADRKHVRESARTQMRAEIERVVSEKTQELQKLQARFDELTEIRNRENERARSRQLDLAEETAQIQARVQSALDSKSEEIEALRKENAILRMEATQNQAKLEASKRESNKAMLLEHLRHEAQIESLQGRIHHLMTQGIYVEKIDEVPEGVEIIASRIIQDVASEGTASLMN